MRSNKKFVYQTLAKNDPYLSALQNSLYKVTKGACKGMLVRYQDLNYYNDYNAVMRILQTITSAYEIKETQFQIFAEETFSVDSCECKDIAIVLANYLHR